MTEDVRYCIDFDQKSWDGLTVFVRVGGVNFEKTGNTPDGRGVYCVLGNFDRACKSLTDDWLFVHVDGRMVPRAEYKVAPAPL